jgi:hypothetical protein
MRIEHVLTSPSNLEPLCDYVGPVRGTYIYFDAIARLTFLAAVLDVKRYFDGERIITIEGSLSKSSPNSSPLKYTTFAPFLSNNLSKRVSS